MLLFQINSLRMLFVRDEAVRLEDPITTSNNPRILDNQLVSLASVPSVSPVNREMPYVNEEGINQIIKNADVHRLNEFVLGGYSNIIVQVIFIDGFND